MSSTVIRKAVISEYGDLSRVSIVTATIDSLREEKVLVRVLYAGFSGSDINMRLG